MTLAVQEFLRESPVTSSDRDNDWQYIMFEYAMNYSLSGIKKSYWEYKQKKAQAVDADTLRKLGYSEEDIAKGL